MNQLIPFEVRVKKFLKEIDKACRKYDLSIVHECMDCLRRVSFGYDPESLEDMDVPNPYERPGRNISGVTTSIQCDLCGKDFYYCGSESYGRSWARDFGWETADKRKDEKDICPDCLEKE